MFARWRHLAKRSQFIILLAQFVHSCSHYIDILSHVPKFALWLAPLSLIITLLFGLDVESSSTFSNQRW